MAGRFPAARVNTAPTQNSVAAGPDSTPHQCHSPGGFSPNSEVAGRCDHGADRVVLEHAHPGLLHPRGPRRVHTVESCAQLLQSLQRVIEVRAAIAVGDSRRPRTPALGLTPARTRTRKGKPSRHRAHSPRSLRCVTARDFVAAQCRSASPASSLRSTPLQKLSIPPAAPLRVRLTGDR